MICWLHHKEPQEGCQKTPRKLPSRKPYFTGILLIDFSVSENYSFLTVLSHEMISNVKFWILNRILFLKFRFFWKIISTLTSCICLNLSKNIPASLQISIRNCAWSVWQSFFVCDSFSLYSITARNFSAVLNLF